MEMGTGKTRVALELVKSTDKTCLWICPFSLKSEIQSEYDKWGYSFPLKVIGVESIGQSDRVFLDTLNYAIIHKPFIVVDESLKIKNVEAKRTQRLLELSKHAEFKLILNGTPLSKNVLDLWSQMEFLSPKILNMSFNHFKNSYCEYYINGSKRGLVKAQHNIEHLTEKIKPFIYDCELDIEPNKKRETFEYSMNDYQEELYQETKERFLNSIMFGQLDFFSLFTSLQVIYTACNERESKLKELLSTPEQFLVFVKYLQNIPDGEISITGSDNATSRKTKIENFKNGKTKNLFVTYGTGSYGLNFQNCKNVIFLDQTFDYAQRIQAEARIYRMGQTQDVNIYDFACTCGLERMVMASLDKKSNLLDEVKKAIEKGNEKEWLKNI
ncbi:MAG: SNF2-related protein [Culicoidibacterales bacterium]